MLLKLMRSKLLQLLHKFPILLQCHLSPSIYKLSRRLETKRPTQRLLLQQMMKRKLQILPKSKKLRNQLKVQARNQLLRKRPLRLKSMIREVRRRRKMRVMKRQRRAMTQRMTRKLRRKNTKIMIKRLRMIERIRKTSSQRADTIKK